ncbi:MAG: nitrous oxide reductase family maturation protein NosD, partial [Dehalococcoidia bacterium]
MKGLPLSLSVLLVGFLASLVLLRGNARADGPIPISDCGILSISGAAYVLTNDINATGTCIVITANNVTLDGDGHSVIGRGDLYGVHILAGTGVTVTSLAVEGFVYGIYLVRSSDNTIAGNTVSSNAFGIGLNSSPNNIISDNIATDNLYYGIFLRSSGNNILTGNTAVDNTYYGIALFSSEDNGLLNNIASRNDLGIALFNSNDSQLTGNTVSENSDFGIYLTRSNRNSIWGNTIQFSGTGVYLQQSSNNELYINNLIRNAPQVTVLGGSDNALNKDPPKGGNYWDSYDTPGEGCANVDDDYFCDDALFVSGNSDDYPWHSESGWVELASSPPLAEAGPDLTI